MERMTNSAMPIPLLFRREEHFPWVAQEEPVHTLTL